MNELRDHRASQSYFDEARRRFDEGRALFKADTLDPDRVSEPDTHALDTQHYFSYCLNSVRCAYSTGESGSTIREHVDELLESYMTYLEARRALPDGVHKFDEHRAQYVIPLQILALATLADVPGSTIRQLTDLNDCVGADAVYDFLAGVQGGSDSLSYPKPYLRLLDVIRGPAEERPRLMSKFLNVWYNQNRGLPWWGQHLRLRAFRYAGYWCFEAAAVTKALQIDDTTYRDHEYYPREIYSIQGN